MALPDYSCDYNLLQQRSHNKAIVSIFPIHTYCPASTMRLLSFFLIAPWLIGVLVHAEQQAAPPTLRVLSRNLYLGADFMVLLDPGANANKSIHQVVQNFYSLVESTDYPSRVKVLAREIKQRDPHVVCLQEVFTYSFSSNSNGSNATVDLDFLSLLLNELQDEYQVACQVATSNPILPYEGDGGSSSDDDTKFLLIQDSEVILTKKSIVQESGSRVFSSTPLELQVQSNRTENPPILNVTRGVCWTEVAMQKETSASSSIVIYDTHLDGSSFLQQQQEQARELVEIAHKQKDSQHSILVGDFNAEQNQTILLCSGENVYDMLACNRTDPFAGANLSTFGTDDALRNVTDSIRIDHMFLSNDLIVSLNSVFGTEPLEELGGMFPSDHYGIEVSVSIPGEEDDDSSSAASLLIHSMNSSPWFLIYGLLSLSLQFL